MTSTEGRRGPVSWPVLVLTGGIVLSLAANLAQATPTLWGWITAATPAGAFLVAVSMLERRAMTTSTDTPQDVPQTSSPSAQTSSAVSAEPRDVPARHDSPTPAPALVDYARRVADEHRAKHGEPISADLIRARLGVSEQLATDLFHVLQPVQAH
ncbi:hypothetical protein AB0K40_40725 [Nonomuraea bangladeshensis]|uniref:Uncharacterized protein n=1 Tax=Nonomuraea bangladeshensis TaxID=404385 RepID=A0ABV3HIA6_9ACTN